MGPGHAKNRLLLLYAIALACRLAMIAWGAIHGEAPVFLYAGRDLPFWDILPVASFQILDRLTGHNLLLLAIVYALASAAIAPVVWNLVSVLGLSSRLALYSALAVAGYPYYASTAWYQPEVGITILLTALYAFTLLRFAQTPTLRHGIVACLCGVLLMLDRPDALIFVLLVGAFGGARAARPKRIVAVVTTMLAIALGTQGLVNAWGTGTFSPVPGKSGYNLLLGHNAAVNTYLRTSHASTMEKFVIHEAFSGFPQEVQEDKQSALYSSLYRDRAFEFIRAHPGLTLVNTGYKFVRYWDWRLEDADNESFLKNAIYTVSYLTALVLALAGTFVLLRQGRKDVVILAWAGMMAFCLPGLVTIPLIRVRMYTEFLLLVLAAAVIDGSTHSRGGPERIPTEKERRQGRKAEQGRTGIA